MATVLYTSSEVRREVKRLMSNNNSSRIVIVGFVGSTPESYLPKPRGLSLYCWDEPPTNPAAIRRLKKLGVRCYFASMVHMKVYWVKDHGCVITSANLSSNALAGDKLKEAGVLFGPDQVRIKDLLCQLDPRPATEKRIAALEERIERERRIRTSPSVCNRMTFADWLAEFGNQKPDWRLGGYDDDGIEPNTAHKRQASEQYGTLDGQNYIECGREVEEDSFLLLYFLNPKGEASTVEWQHVDSVLPNNRAERKKTDYTHQAVQWQKLSAYRSPPFAIDKRFRQALRTVSKALSKPKRHALLSLDTAERPDKSLLKLLSDAYRDSND